MKSAGGVWVGVEVGVTVGVWVCVGVALGVGVGGPGVFVGEGLVLGVAVFKTAGVWLATVRMPDGEQPDRPSARHKSNARQV